MLHVQHSMLVRAPQQLTFDVLADVGAYPEFLDEMTSVDIIRRRGKSLQVEFAMMLIRSIRYIVNMRLEPPKRLAWELVSGDLMKKNSGSWELTLRGNEKTHAVYTMDVEFSVWVPQAIIEPLMQERLPNMLSAFQKRIEERHRGEHG